MVSDRTLSRILPPSSVVLLGDLIRVALAITLVIVMVFVAIYYRFQGDHLNDFRVFYYSTQAWLDGGDMYGPTAATSVPVGDGQYHNLWNMNPPHFHLVLLPFARLPLPAAMAGWVAMNIGILVCSLTAIARALDVGWTRSGTVWTIFAATIFSATCGLVATGQVAWIIMLPVTLAWAAARRGAWHRAAVLLGLAASVKPFLGIFLIYFALRRMWREVVLMLGAGLACGVLGIAVFGWDAQWRWVEMLRAVDWAWAPMNSSITGFLTRILSDNPFVQHMVDAPWLVRPLALSAGLALGLVTFHRLLKHDASRRAADLAFAALLLLALLLSPLGWIYYLWLAAGPLLALFWFRAEELPRRTWLFLVLAVPGLLWPVYPFIWVRDVPWAAATIAGIYFWSVLSLWCAVMRDAHPLRAV